MQSIRGLNASEKALLLAEVLWFEPDAIPAAIAGQIQLRSLTITFELILWVRRAFNPVVRMFLFFGIWPHDLIFPCVGSRPSVR